MYDSEIAEVIEYHHAMLGDRTRTTFWSPKPSGTSGLTRASSDLTLSLIDSEATLGEIATAIRTAYPTQLPTSAHAVAYVEEIVRDYAG